MFEFSIKLQCILPLQEPITSMISEFQSLMAPLGWVNGCMMIYVQFYHDISDSGMEVVNEAATEDCTLAAERVDLALCGALF